MNSILFFVIGGLLSISFLFAYEKYQENIELKNKIKELMNNDLSSKL